MRKKKVLTKSIKYIAMAGICGCLLVPGAAFAKNSSTSQWRASTAYGGSSFISEARPKEDKSSVYVACYSVKSLTTGAYTSGTITVIPYGSRNEGGSYTNMVYEINGQGYSAAHHILSRGTSKYMTNFIKEAGGNYAKVHYDTREAYTLFEGGWSPDSN